MSIVHAELVCLNMCGLLNRRSKGTRTDHPFCPGRPYRWRRHGPNPPFPQGAVRPLPAAALRCAHFPNTATWCHSTLANVYHTGTSVHVHGMRLCHSVCLSVASVRICASQCVCQLCVSVCLYVCVDLCVYMWISVYFTLYVCTICLFVCVRARACVCVCVQTFCKSPAFDWLCSKSTPDLSVLIWIDITYWNTQRRVNNNLRVLLAWQITSSTQYGRQL